MDEWSQAQPMSSVTLEEMDRLILKLKLARELYDERKRAATEAHDYLESIEKDVMNILRLSGKNSYKVDGVASVHIRHKEMYTTPKTNEAKIKLFNYIKEKYGPDSLMSLTSINSNTLNSWANKEAESGVMSIPGLEQPTTQEILSVTKA